MLFSQYESLNISRIGFGCASLSGEGAGYGFGDISQKDSIALVHEAIDLGINLFDNAPIYGFGLAEKRLGESLLGKREKAFIISKCGVDWHENGRVNMSNSAKVCEKQLHESLKRLKTDYVDIYMVHWPDATVPIEETLDVLIKAKTDGKIRFIGLSNTNNSDLSSATEKTDIDFIQAESNIFNDGYKNIQHSLLDGLFKTSWGTFDKGILTQSVTKDRVFDKSDCRSWAPWWKKSNWKEKVDKASLIHQYLNNNSIDPVSFMIQFNLFYKKVNSVLCGFRKTSHLQSIKSINTNIDEVHYQNIVKMING